MKEKKEENKEKLPQCVKALVIGLFGVATQKAKESAHTDKHAFIHTYTYACFCTSVPIRQIGSIQK